MSTVTASRPALVKPAGAAPRATGTAGATGSSAAGRTRVTARALNRLIAAVAAEALGVDARSVTIELSDSSGQLVVAVRSPLRVVSLGRVADDRGIVARTGGTLLERAAAAQQQIRTRATALSGSNIQTVTVRLTGVDIQAEKRIR